MNIPTTSTKDKKFKKISQHIVSEMKRLKVPGAAIGIITGQIFGMALELYFNIKLKPPKPIETSQELKELVERYKIGTNCFDISIQGKHPVCHHVPLGGFPHPIRHRPCPTSCAIRILRQR